MDTARLSMTSTIEQLIRSAASRLAAASPSPRLDAEVLVMHVTGHARTTLITRGHETLPAAQEQQLQWLLERRAHGEPVAYLTGVREFWSLELAVTPDVLIPRPETELLVEQALARIPKDTTWTVADLGTGSGAVALALARERPRCTVIATDASTAALAVARRNAQRLGIGNVEFRHGDWLAPLAGVPLDMIVSNPPYIREDDPHLAQGDVRFEPRGALVAGADGLDAIRRIAVDAPLHLQACGWLLLEHGYDQAERVGALFRALHYRGISHSCDLHGWPRITAGHL